MILAYEAESADMEEKQALESELASIELQLEAHAGFDEFDRKVNQWIDDLIVAIMSSEFFIVYNFTQHKMDFDFNVLRGVIQTPICFSKCRTARSVELLVRGILEFLTNLSYLSQAAFLGWH